MGRRLPLLLAAMFVVAGAAWFLDGGSTAGDPGLAIDPSTLDAAPSEVAGSPVGAWYRAFMEIADTDEQNEDWFVFDDDEVSPCKTEDVLKLKGGGDWHMSYLNFYRAKK